MIIFLTTNFIGVHPSKKFKYSLFNRVSNRIMSYVRRHFFMYTNRFIYDGENDGLVSNCESIRKFFFVSKKILYKGGPIFILWIQTPKAVELGLCSSIFSLLRSAIYIFLISPSQWNMKPLLLVRMVINSANLELTWLFIHSLKLELRWPRFSLKASAK